MMSMFKGRHLSDSQSAFNKVMAGIRVSVEWGYNEVVRFFPITDWWKQLKIGHIHVESLWHLAVFLSNCRVSHFSGNSISDFFNGVSPPSLAEYLTNFTSHW